MRPPLPPFTRGDRYREGAAGRGRLEYARSGQGREAYTADSTWRNRSELFQGREAIVEFLSRKWAPKTTGW